MRKTRPQLASEVLQLKEELKRTENALFECADREKIAALYLQTVRVMFDRIGGHIQSVDLDRLLDTLGYGRFPEGF